MVLLIIFFSSFLKKKSFNWRAVSFKVRINWRIFRIDRLKFLNFFSWKLIFVSLQNLFDKSVQ